MEEEESDEGEGNTDQEQVVFAQNPSDLLTEDETSMLETIFNEMDTEKDGILRPKQLADALKRVGVQTDEETLRRQLMMGEGENEGIDQSDFIQLMAIHMKRMLTANDVKLAFSSFDLNNDGYIDKEELAHAMSHIGFHMEPEEIDENFAMRTKTATARFLSPNFARKWFFVTDLDAATVKRPARRRKERLTPLTPRRRSLLPPSSGKVSGHRPL